MKRFIPALILTLAAAVCLPCYAQEAPKETNPVKHVVLVIWDGYGANYVNWDEVPTLKKMRDNGAWTLHSRCVLPSVSAVNWATILMGCGSELHGYRHWGSSKPDLPSRVLTDKKLYPDIFHVVHTQAPDALTCSVYDWDVVGKLHELPDEKHTKYFYYEEFKDTSVPQTRCTTEKTLTLMTDQFIEYLKENPTLAFIGYADPDGAGHKCGWGSESYHKTVADLDTYLAKIIKFLEENDRMKDTVVIFTSDHGGSGKGHGEGNMLHMETPYVIYGAGVKPGEITDVVVGYDTAPTIAWALGLEEPQAWRGKPIKSAFTFGEN